MGVSSPPGRSGQRERLFCMDRPPIVRFGLVRVGFQAVEPRSGDLVPVAVGILLEHGQPALAADGGAFSFSHGCTCNGVVQNLICQATGDCWLLKLTDKRFPFFSCRTGIGVPAFAADGWSSEGALGGR